MSGLVSPWAMAAAGFAGLTVLLLLRPRARLDGLHSPPGAKGRTSRRVRLLAGRPDGTPLRRRVTIGALLTVAAGLLLMRSAGIGIWAWAVGTALGAIATVLLGWLEPGAVRRRRHRLVLQAPQALELLAACLAAGLPVRNACREVVAAFDGPVAEDLGRVAALTELGVGDADAWRALASHPQLGPAAADLARSVESGTLLVEGLRHHATRAREQRQAALQVVARSVGVRSVLPLMCCFIPAFVLLGVLPTVASTLAQALRS